jgi:hypothetical protein
MKSRIAMTVMLALLAGSAAVVAQNPPPNAGTPAPVAAPSPQPAPPQVEAPRAVASNADARNCLEFPDNLEVIKCAEKYLQRKRKG